MIFINNVHTSNLKIRILIHWLAALLLTGCGLGEEANVPSPAVKAQPAVITVNLKGGKNLNPDLDGRPSPLVVRIYLLENIAKFNNSDFFALYENDQSLLSSDIKYRDEFEIKPDQALNKQFELKEGGYYLAIIAAFRDLDHAQWKAYHEIQPNPTRPYLVDLDFTSFSIK
ncbi:MAG: type VI secretion system lipoprotein TssJ [Methylococcaceae bacterium]|nr:type VI secretion system lipoprotein TssJ [Methylococcaceae bacterium]